jgi:hypothetical protein
MVKTCKHAEQNQHEHKCSDYFIRDGRIVMCRLTEWKQRRKVCPYDKTIFSTPKGLKKAIIDKKQTRLKDEDTKRIDKHDFKHGCR